uniref:RRM domain-containing protein n=1 Tax=Chromera velia CCMP2878 TaxID=1169474 RepID=A0A0G4GL28_9ALVE|eukprot:Cvel_22388.t1-p1 / transcript=Cvel_22388.t1 / gene=Cvel_22388 / organism=Chromera_velia_CCMP2878 / gene_product=MKI67 FHA domain-interacting nucleolar, putative / transcript_product=MKI67 FHA domain-interacting nucleolar, putative / location=Cvel_scaffold2195:8444-11829(+) / protein_length=394 / sequence_SO=supercontig / SO=protein_coding / is_pseudo=false
MTTKGTTASAAAGSVPTGRGALIPKGRGVLLVARLPSTFRQDDIRKFFEQFGNITRLRMAKNKKTGTHKGYGWLEFEHKEVAEIVAKTMNNYLLEGRNMVVKVKEPEELHPDVFKKWNVQFRAINRAERHHNMMVASVGLLSAGKLEKKLAKQKKTEKKLKELGIEYSGYVSITDFFQDQLEDLRRKREALKAGSLTGKVKRLMEADREALKEDDDEGEGFLSEDDFADDEDEGDEEEDEDDERPPGRSSSGVAALLKKARQASAGGVAKKEKKKAKKTEAVPVSSKAPKKTLKGGKGQESGKGLSSVSGLKKKKAVPAKEEEEAEKPKTKKKAPTPSSSPKAKEPSKPKKKSEVTSKEDTKAKKKVVKDTKKVKGTSSLEGASKKKGSSKKNK